MNVRWTQKDLFFMQEALCEAKKAYEKNEVPIGAVIIDEEGKCIGKGHNQVEKEQCQIAHAECQALLQATHTKNNWRLDGCTIFITLEPCTMCLAALRLSRVVRIVFGAYSPVFGYTQDKDSFLKIESTESFSIQGGLEKEASEALLQDFFKKQR
ncbi:nucleoside deaminase [Candidatus Babeliales bacterium]|nr:nucleoside deaminase [Candidatus Babeliales bacterium]